jgi:hypothetical protein
MEEVNFVTFIVHRLTQDRILTSDLEAKVEKEQEATIRRLEAELVQMRAATTQKEADPDDGSPSIQTLRYQFRHLCKILHSFRCYHSSAFLRSIFLILLRTVVPDIAYNTHVPTYHGKFFQYFFHDYTILYVQ